MLEIRYKKDTGVITASASSPEFMGGHLKPKIGEKIALLDIPSPEEMRALIYDEATKTLVNNPAYTKFLPRDLAAEIDELKTEIKILKGIT